MLFMVAVVVHVVLYFGSVGVVSHSSMVCLHPQDACSISDEENDDVPAAIGAKDARAFLHLGRIL